MANMLETIMRLTDDYTATMRKVISSADQYNKVNQQAQKETSNLQSQLKSVGGGASVATSGMDQLVLRLGKVVTATYAAKKGFEFLWESIQTGAKQQTQKSTFQALMGNQTLGNDVYNFVSAYAKKSALDRESLASATTSFLAFTRDPKQLQQMLDLTQRLYMWNPEQGAEGAVFALKEVLTGQTMSLKNRFNMNGVSAEKIQELSSKSDIAGTISYLDQVFNRFGATQGVVDANFNSLTVQMDHFKKGLMTALGDESNGAVQSLAQTFKWLNSEMDAGNFQGFFNAVANGANGLASAAFWLSQNIYTVVPAVGAVIGAFVLYSAAAKAIKLITETLDITVSIATGNWIKLGLAIAGAVGGGILANKLINVGAGGDAEKQLLSTKEAMDKLSADMKKNGVSPKVNANITNSDPIKVSGQVEIEKENLKYVFEASTMKFFAQLNATSVNPSVNIENQTITQTADLDEVDRYLGGMVAGRAAVSAGGSYK